MNDIDELLPAGFREEWPDLIPAGVCLSVKAINADGNPILLQARDGQMSAWEEIGILKMRIHDLLHLADSPVRDG